MIVRCHFTSQEIKALIEAVKVCNRVHNSKEMLAPILKQFGLSIDWQIPNDLPIAKLNSYLKNGGSPAPVIGKFEPIKKKKRRT